jgi:murein DD-endopeptidase MepM/ murein hydrolase activator NlpD
MAEERAAVTLTLDDEMSSGLQVITQHVNDLTKSFGDVQRQGDTTFRTLQDNAKKTQEAMGETGRALQKLPDTLRGPLQEVSKLMQSLPGGFGVLSRTMSEATGIASTLSRVLGGVATSGAGVGAAVVASGVALVAFTRHLAEASERAKNLRIELGESSDRGIRDIRRLAEGVGIGAEQAQQSLTQFAKMYQDMSRGYFSQLRQILEGHGEAGHKMADELEGMLRSGRDSSDAYLVLLQRLSRQGGTALRQFADEVHRPYAEIERMARAAPQLHRSWAPDPTQQREIERTYRALKLMFDDVSHSAEDAGNKAQFTIEKQFVGALDRALPHISAFSAATKAMFDQMGRMATEGVDSLTRQAIEGGVPLGDPGAQRSEAERQRQIGIDALKRKYFSPEEANKRLQRRLQQEEAPPNFIPGPPTGLELLMPRQTGGPAYGGRPYLVGERGPELFVPQASGNVISQAAGGAGMTLHSIERQTEEGTGYEREIRDVLVWMKQQMEDPAKGTRGGVGGAGAGGGMGGLPGMGGAGGAGGTGSNPQGPATGSSPQSPAATAEQQRNLAMPGGGFDKPTLTGGVPPGGRGAAPPAEWLGNTPMEQQGNLLGATPATAAGNAPGGGTVGTGQAAFLAAHRQKILAEINGDPAKREQFMRLVQNEVGTQSARAQEAFVQSTLDRWAARGQSFSDAMRNNPRYFPSSSIRGQSPSERLRGDFGGYLERAGQGQAIFPGATGNASDAPGNRVLSGHRRRGEVAGEVSGEGFIYEQNKRDVEFRRRLAAARGDAPQVQTASPGPGGNAGQGGVAVPPGSTVNPIAGTVGSGIGEARPGHLHQGVDIVAPHGSTVVSPKEGTVVKAEFQKSRWYGDDSGGVITVQHADGTYSRFLHISSLGVKVGEKVGAGQNIGLSGTAAQTPHLHYELWRGGYPGSRGSQLVDPKQAYGWKTGQKITTQPTTQVAGADSPHRVRTISVGPGGETLAGPPPAGGVPSIGAPILPSGLERHGETEAQKEERRERAIQHMRGWRGQDQVSVDRASIDKSIAGQHGGHIGKAQVDVNFHNVPKNVKTTAKGDGAFKDVRLERTPAMNTTGSQATDTANYAAEE